MSCHSFESLHSHSTVKDSLHGLTQRSGAADSLDFLFTLRCHVASQYHKDLSVPRIVSQVVRLRVDRQLGIILGRFVA